jgi:hypothetical protein
MRRDFLSRFERSVVFQVNNDSGRPKRMTAHRSKNAGSKRPAPNHSIGFGSRHHKGGYVLHSRPNEAAVIPLVMAAQTRALMGSNFVKSFASFALRSSPTGHFNASPTA